MYFIYPSIIMLSLLGIDFIQKIIKKRYLYITFLLVIIFSLTHTAYWMIKNHPNQNVYFNKLAGKNVQNNFDMDYWGLSYKQNFEFLLNNEKKEKYYIWNASKTKIEYSLFSLNQSDRLKFIQINKKEAEYLITNYYLDQQIYNEDFFKKYKILNDIKVDNISVNTIYKKINF